MKNHRYFLHIIFSFVLLTITGQYLPAQTTGSEQNYARNSPGVVMVQAVFSATVYVNKVEINKRVFDRLVDSVKKLDTSGKILSPEQKLDIVVKALYRSPLRFFSASEEYFRQAHRVQSTGTGFLITDDGYIITNCHIVDKDSAFIRNKFILETFQEVTRANISSLQSSWAMTLSGQQREMLYNAYGLIYSQLSSMILFDLKKEIFVLYRNDMENGETSTASQPARVIVKGQPMPGKDVAVLKIDEVVNMPCLVFNNDSLARIGTPVLVLGFPEPVTSNTFLSSDAAIEPTLTAGIISAIKKSIGGWPVIQMDAAISHGSSGSPVCNDKGEVIALATFGSIDQGGSALASGFNFAIPVSVINEFIEAADVQPAIGKATHYFNEGISLFYQQFYRKALERFDRVKNMNENYPQLYFYMKQCKQKIDRGADRQLPSRSIVFWIMGLITVMTIVYLIYKIRKNKGIA